MDEVRNRIKRNSMIIGIALALVAALSIISLVSGIGTWIAEGPVLDTANIKAGGTFAMQTFLTALLGYTIFIFLRIGRRETPFFKELPRMIKTAAVLLFLAVQVPRWFADAAFSVANGTVSFVVLDNLGILVLVLAFILFCFGQMLQYGFLVQEENYEII